MIKAKTPEKSAQKKSLKVGDPIAPKAIDVRTAWILPLHLIADERAECFYIVVNGFVHSIYEEGVQALAVFEQLKNKLKTEIDFILDTFKQDQHN